MSTRQRRAVARVAAGAVSLFAALAMTTLPAYADDPAESSESPSPSASPEPTPTDTPPASESPEPGDGAKPADPPSGTPSEPGDAPEPPAGGDGEAGEEDEGPQVDLAVSTPGSKVTVGSPGKFVRVDVDNWSPNPAKNVQLTVEVGDLSDQVDVELPGEDFECEVEGSTSVCQYPDLAGNDTDTFVNFKVTPKPDAKEGPAGTVRLTLTSDNPDSDPDNNKADVEIELVGPGPDLTAYAAQVGPVKPGKTVKPDLAFVNQGDQPSGGFSLTITLPRHASFTERVSGCSYSSGGRKVSCADSDFPLEPGEGAFLHPDAFRIKVAKGAPGPLVLGRGAFTVHPLGSASNAKVARDNGSSLVSRTGGARVAGAGDAVEGDNTVTFPVKTSKNPADLAIKTSTAYGEKGDTVKVKFTVVNHGPADLTQFHFMLTAPVGTDIKGVPSNLDCGPEVGDDIENGELDCWYHRPLPGGKAVSVTVAFEITADEVGDHGRARVFSATIGGDPNPRNNLVKVQILPPGAAPGSGGGLPVTGASLGGLFGAGAMALLLGGALVMVARWRRTPAAVTGSSGAAAA
ncbi:MAG: hypothetical protein GEU94_04090 [Micromonosporaceae bacterium]|nr:hypothetical protein [Micromonosporaceae bacterium]